MEHGSQRAVDLLKGQSREEFLLKAGAKFSAATKTALGGAHEAMKTACDSLDALGYADKAATPDDLSKLSGELETVTKAMAMVTTERDSLATRVKELEALPAPGKALLKAINKADDVTAADVKKTEATPITDYRGEVNEVATLIKSIHAGRIS